MATITIPKKEYEKLIDARLRYERVREILEEDLFSAPPMRKRKDVLRTLKATGKYSKAFLKSFSRGLTRSSYFRA